MEFKYVVKKEQLKKYLYRRHLKINISGLLFFMVIAILINYKIFSNNVLLISLYVLFITFILGIIIFVFDYLFVKISVNRMDNIFGKHSLIYDGIYYQDEEYGNVRILAAAKTVFPCGTIIEINNGINPPFLGVVLDSGSSMQKAWNSSRTVWIDLAYATQNDARNTTTPGGNGIQFTVKRYGF